MNFQDAYIFILNSNIINFTIMITVLVWVFKKFKLGRIIDSLSDDIKNNVITSAETVQNAINVYKETRKESRNIDSKKEEIINIAKSNIVKLNEKSNYELQAKETELEKNSEKTKIITADRKKQQTTNYIKNVVYDLSTESIKTILNEDMHNKIIADCLSELEKIEGVI